MKRRDFIGKTGKIITGTMLFSPFVNAEPRYNNDIMVERPSPERWSNDTITVSWIGHATVLINFYGKIIITDPVLFDTIGLYIFGYVIGQNRYSPPALRVNDFPKPDLILLSHAHMDHMDYRTLKAFTKKYPNQIDCVTAYNTKDVIEDLKWKTLQEMDWDDTLNLYEHGFKLTACKVQHFGWRFPWEKDRSKGYMMDGRSFNAYMIEKEGKKVFFGGDTAYHEHFQKYNFSDVEIAIMPVGAYNPWKRNHCDPEEALIMATRDIKAKAFIPIHCNTFKQGMEPREEPLKWTAESAPKYNIELGLNNIGGTYVNT